MIPYIVPGPHCGAVCRGGAIPGLYPALPWTVHGVVYSFHINMAKSDHKVGGITVESAKATGFTGDPGDGNSPLI